MRDTASLDTRNTARIGTRNRVKNDDILGSSVS